MAEQYIAECSNTGKIPNIAGFCRYLGISGAKFAELTASHPEEAARIHDVFEDEAINSDMSASLLSAYLKTRLGYGEAPSDGQKPDEPVLNIVFEHDILRDGQ